MPDQTAVEEVPLLNRKSSMTFLRALSKFSASNDILETSSNNSDCGEDHEIYDEERFLSNEECYLHDLDCSVVSINQNSVLWKHPSKSVLFPELTRGYLEFHKADRVAPDQSVQASALAAAAQPEIYPFAACALSDEPANLATDDGAAELWTPGYQHMYKTPESTFLSNDYVEEEASAVDSLDPNAPIRMKSRKNSLRNPWGNIRSTSSWQKDVIQHAVERMGDPALVQPGSAEPESVGEKTCFSEPIPLFALTRSFCSSQEVPKSSVAPYLVTLATLAIVGIVYVVCSNQFLVSSGRSLRSANAGSRVVAETARSSGFSLAHDDATVKSKPARATGLSTKSKDGADSNKLVASSTMHSSNNGGNDRRAAVLYSSKLSLNGSSFRKLEDSGYAALARGDIEYAVAALSQAIKINRNDARARQLLAYALIAAEAPKEAAEQFRAWQQLANAGASAQIAAGASLARASDTVPAQRYFEDLIDRSEGDLAVLIQIAKKCEALGFYDQSMNATYAGLESESTGDKHPFERLMRRLKSKSVVQAQTSLPAESKHAPRVAQ
jgi:hypothetical protein